MKSAAISVPTKAFFDQIWKPDNIEELEGQIK
jgi:hypothetical protein